MNNHSVLPIHQRIAELTVAKTNRDLTEEEIIELDFCLKANIRHCWEVAYLVNMDLMNQMNRTINYQNECFLDGGVENV